MSRARDNANLGVQAGSGLDASDITSGVLPVGVTGGSGLDPPLFLENTATTQNLSGTYSTERLYFNDSYQLTGDVTVTGHLALGTIADEDVVITQDSTERTITGSGTIESGELLSSKETDLTGMTGELGSVVTGSPNLNLRNATFPTDVARSYEEGTWTPTFEATSATFSFTTQIGNYTKIGNMLHWSFKIQTNLAASGTLTGGVTITGLPFTSVATYYNSASFGQIYNIDWRTGFEALTGIIYPSTAYISLLWADDDSTGSSVKASDFDKAVLILVMSGSHQVV